MIARSIFNCRLHQIYVSFFFVLFLTVKNYQLLTHTLYAQAICAVTKIHLFYGLQCIYKRFTEKGNGTWRVRLTGWNLRDRVLTHWGLLSKSFSIRIRAMCLLRFFSLWNEIFVEVDSREGCWQLKRCFGLQWTNKPLRRLTSLCILL